MASLVGRVTVLYDGAAGSVESCGFVGKPTAGVLEVEIDRGIIALAQDKSATLVKAKVHCGVDRGLLRGVVLVAVFCARQAWLM